jgi:hypothetical protein
MKFHRWLLGAWMLASILWIGHYFWRVDFYCAFYPCEYWGGDMTAMFNVYGHLAMIFGIPVAVLAAGTAIFWIIRRFLWVIHGFQRDPSAN